MQKEEIIKYFNKLYPLNEEQQLYLQIHAARFQTIIALLKNDSVNKSVLDIGPSYLSYLLNKVFATDLSLLGFKGSDSLGGHLPSIDIFSKADFIEQDLNYWDASASDKRFDTIICAEVIEHLFSSPMVFFKNINTILKSGGLLVLQTPNAVSLRKRLLFLSGKNPFEMPRENFKNPGHYREYTYKELENLGKGVGLDVEKVLFEEYFEYPSKLSEVYRSFSGCIPDGLKSGITVVFRKT